MSQYSLNQILSVIADKQGNRRLILNSKPLGGIGSTAVYLMIISLPFIEYGILFNEYVFSHLGIATAIIAYIVFLSTTMMVVFGIVWYYNHKLIKKINTSWADSFPNVGLNLIFASGRAPYSRFFEYYSEAVRKGLFDDELKSFLISSIALMEEDNRDLLVAMETHGKSKYS